MTKKPKILSRLRIDEVSSVTSGAGEGVKILLMKRAAEGDTTFLSFNDIMKRDEKALRGRHFYGDDFRKYIASEEDEVDEDNDPDEDILPPLLEQMVNALCEANPALQRQDAIHHLLHSPSGRQLAAHIASISKGDDTMNRTEQLQQMAKSAGGVRNVAKYIVSKQDSLGVTEHELTELINVEAQKSIRSGERPAQCFSRFFQAPENEELRKAIIVAKTAGHVGYLQSQYAKSYPREAITEPRVADGADATDVNGDRDEAIKQLNAIAEQQRSRSPEKSVAQLFALVMNDPKNSALAARALARPGQSVASENRQ